MKTAFRMFLIAFALAPNALAQDADKSKVSETKAETLGMSIVGNHEAPKALVLVPWKPSEPGKPPEISTKADKSVNPIDKEAFMRLLQYHQIAKTNEAPSMSGCECKPDRAQPSNRRK